MGNGLILLVFSLAAAERERVIDAFDYRQAAAAQQAWEAGAGTPPVEVAMHGGKRYLEFSAPFGSQRELPRTIHDRSIELDLSVPAEFRLEMAAEKPEAIGHVTLYFRSGKGWYGAGANLAKAGWQTLRFTKSAFRPEDEPAGWHRIDGIRISCWRGRPVDTAVRVRRLTAVWHDVALLVPDPEVHGGQREVAFAAEVVERVGEMLQRIGLVWDPITDSQLAAPALGTRRLVIVPYHPRLGSRATARLVEFVRNGGKVFIAYSVPAPLAEAMGFGQLRYVSQKRRGWFAEMRFEADDVPGLPERVRQASWNITAAEPVSSDARVVGYWFNDKGQSTGQPALLLSRRGALLTHILLEDDRSAKERMLAAVAGKLCPELWPQMARAALERLGQVGHLERLEAVRQWAYTKGNEPARELLAKAMGAVDEAKSRFAAADRGRDRAGYPRGIARLAEARRWLTEAYLRAQPSPAVEGRAIWNHSGTGAYPGDWERTARALAEAGFNMVLPNMLWAGRAHYPSDLLPRSRTFREYGDQIAQCVAACHEFGLEVHVWKVNHNLSGAPAEFVEKLREEGRTQVTVEGEPHNWLCPSHPKNFELERDSMLEVVRRYDVDGIHFDYIRYPGPQCCYCDGCRGRFEQSTGRRVVHWPEDCYSGPLREAYRQWRCDNITRLVAAVSGEAKKIRPDIRISAAVFGAYPACRDSVGQDWVAWIKAGYLDFVCPMDYTQDDPYFISLVENQLRLVDGRIPVYPGVGAWRLTPDRVVGQIHLARSLGAAGFTIFNLNEQAAETVLPALRLGVGAQTARPPHAGAR